MGVSKTIMEKVELASGGELSVYASGSSRIALTVTVNDSEFNVWVTPDEAKQFVEKINLVLAEV